MERQINNSSRNRFYNQLFQDSDLGIVSFDTNFSILEFNNAFSSHLGYEENELLNKCLWDLLPEKWKNYVEHIVQNKVKFSGFSGYTEVMFILADGRILPFEQNIFLLRDNYGNISGYYAYVREITEKKQTELKLENLAGFGRLISDISSGFLSLPYGFLREKVTDSLQKIGLTLHSPLQFLHVSKKYASEKERDYFWIEENSVYSYNNQLLNFLDTHEVRIKLYSDQICICNPLKNLEVFNLIRYNLSTDKNISAFYLIPLFSKEELIGVWGIAYSDQEKLYTPEETEQILILSRILGNAIFLESAQSQLKVSEQRFKVLINSTSAAILIVRKNRIIFANQVVTELLKITSEQVLGRNFAEFVHPDFRSLLIKKHHERMKGMRGIQKYEVKVISSDGSEMWAEVTSDLIEYLDEPAVYITAVDITQRKEAERQLEDSREKYKELFENSKEILESERRRLAKELHDVIGQRLTFTKLNIELFRENEGINSLYLDTATENLIKLGQDLKSIVKSLTPTVIEKYELTKAVKLLVEEFNQSTDYNISYQVNATNMAINKKVELDVYRIFQEALNNAVKHSDAGMIEVKLAVTKNVIKGLIRDNGKGFNISDLESKSLGWGLMHMSDRTEMLGGNFHIFAEPEKGTEIKFEIPNG